MEKKKLLLVAISLGIFLVIVTGAAFVIFSPSARSAPAESTYVPVREPVYPGIPAQRSTEQPLEERSLQREEDTQRATPVAPTRVPEVPAPPLPQNTAGAKKEDENGQTLINVSRPRAVAVPDTPPQGRAAGSSLNQGGSAALPAPVSPPAPAPARNTAAPKPATPPSSGSAASQTTKTVSAVKSTPAPVPAPAQTAPRAPAPLPAPVAPAGGGKLYDTYWIQTGSFTVKTRAEGVKDTLAARGIASIIENRDINGRTFFRVRVGPYTSKNEAEYWLSLVKAIDGFQESQVWLNQSRM